ncbi:MAG TPA: type II toxin-antitoxin system VapC family toxin [Caulobacteraceae bacterium]|jgi:predicted nucleic-acid-binding protein
MLAVDTNVVVRFITADDPDQYARARAFIAANDVWVAVTVVLETAWVLRSFYHRPPAEVCAAIRGLAGLPRISVEQAPAVEQALGWHEAGMDFADALHWAIAGGCEAYVTFDKDCLSIGRRLGLPVRAP